MSATDSFTTRHVAPAALPASQGATVIPPRPVLVLVSLGLLASVCAMIAGVDIGSVLAAMS